MQSNRPTTAISVREITKSVQPFLETIGDFATTNLLRISAGVLWFLCSLVSLRFLPDPAMPDPK